MNKFIVYIKIEGIFLKDPIEDSYKEKFILNDACFDISHSTYIDDEEIPSDWTTEYRYRIEKYAGYSCWSRIKDMIESIVDNNECNSNEGITISIQYDYLAKDIEVYHVPKKSLKGVFKEIRLALPNLEIVPILLQEK